MTKIVFGEREEDVVYLDPFNGVVETDKSLSEIEYTFDGSNVKLDISGQWFTDADIQDLIDFLRAAKEYMENTAKENAF